MILGIKETPVAGKPSTIEVFYAGHDATEMVKKHAELLKTNNDSRFYRLLNPSLVPLQSVITPTEDHPDEIAARKQREEAAKAAKEQPKQAKAAKEQSKTTTTK